MSPHRRAIRRLRSEVSTKRSALAAGWKQVELHRAKPPQPRMAELLPAVNVCTSPEEMDVEELRAYASELAQMHARRMSSIDDETRTDLSEVVRLRELLNRINSGAARDVQALASQIRTMPSSTRSGGVRTADAASTAVGASDHLRHLDPVSRREALVAKGAEARELAKRAEQLEALVWEEHARRAVAERSAAARAARRAVLESGARVHRWDPSRRMLVPYEIALVAGGQCLEAVDATAQSAPLLLPLSRVEAVMPSTACEDAFADGPIPSHAWLFFSVRSRSTPDPKTPSAARTASASALAPMAATVSTGSMRLVPSSGGVVVRDARPTYFDAHFACATRAEMAAWLLGLDESLDTRLTPPQAGEREEGHSSEMTKAWSLGRILWHQVHGRLEEEARARGLRPFDLLARSVLAAAADWRQVQARPRQRRILTSGQ